MRDDFCVFIISHGRPDKIYTHATLLKAGYTGKLYIVIDDEDKTGGQYREKYGDIVLMFSKDEIAKTFDEGDNFNNRRTTTYVRNACFGLAEKVGCKYFMVLDDDYTKYYYCSDVNYDFAYTRILRTMDQVLDSLLEFYESIPALTLAISQGGDHIGGASAGGSPTLRRKAMNSFICSVERPFNFFGRLNEDVNTYVTLNRLGGLFLTAMQVKLDQNQTQATAGGMSEAYLDSGTYVKSFYTVMYAPSCTKVGVMGDPRSGDYRLHHVIDWPRTAPCILRERHRKA